MLKVMNSPIILAVAAGGAIGSLARYMISVQAKALFAAHLPVATLMVNIIGSFAMGMVMASSLKHGSPLFMGVTVGLFGGFTTFSTFSFETLQFLQKQAWLMAFSYAGLSVAAATLACMLGFILIKSIG